MHPFQHPVVDVLKRHIDVLGNLFLTRIEVEQIIGDLLGIEVERSDPSNVRNLHERAKQRGETASNTQVHAVVDRILGNEVELFHAFAGEAFRFGNNRFDRSAPLFPAHDGNGAEGAIPVTPFGDLHIGTMRFAESQARGVRVVEIRRFADPQPLLAFAGREEVATDFRDLSEFAGAHHAVQFRQLFQQVSLIALGETACGNQDPAGAFLLQLAMFENRIDRLLLGFFDEAAGIDDHDFGFLGIAG